MIIINGIYIAPYVSSNRRALYNTHNLIKLLHTEGYNYTWSVESLNLATYRMFRDKGQRSHKGH